MTKKELWKEAEKEAQYCLEQWQAWNLRKAEAEEKSEYWKNELAAIRLVCHRLDCESKPEREPNANQ
jgi:hypothetical protein